MVGAARAESVKGCSYEEASGGGSEEREAEEVAGSRKRGVARGREVRGAREGSTGSVEVMRGTLRARDGASGRACVRRCFSGWMRGWRARIAASVTEVRIGPEA